VCVSKGWNSFGRELIGGKVRVLPSRVFGYNALSGASVCKSTSEIMVYGIAIASGALVFSLVCSVFADLRRARPEKSEYDIWLDDITKCNVITSRCDFSK
jgi:hypothetical protein